MRLVIDWAVKYNNKQIWATSWQNQQNDCAPSETQISLGIWQSDQSRRCPHDQSLGSYLPIECTAKTDQTGRISRLIRVFARRTVSLLVLSWGGSSGTLRYFYLPGVQSAAVNVICELARKNPRNYLSLAPLFFKLMTSSTNNWVLIKIIKLVSRSSQDIELVSRSSQDIELVSRSS